METLDDHYARHASRKFIFTMLGLVFATVLMGMGEIDAVTYRDIVIFLGGIYTAGNVWQKYIEKRSEKDETS